MPAAPERKGIGPIPYPPEIDPAFYEPDYIPIDYRRYLGHATPISTLRSAEERLRLLEDWLEFLRELGTLGRICEVRDREALRIWNGEA